MAKTKVKTEVKEKSTKELETEIQNATTGVKDDLPGKEGTKNTLAAAKKQEENKDGLRVDPTITQEESERAAAENEAAMKAKLEREKVVVKEAQKFESDTVNVSKKPKVLAEGKGLKEVVAADAKERGKEFTTCPVTGVLIVK